VPASTGLPFPPIFFPPRNFGRPLSAGHPPVVGFLPWFLQPPFFSYCTSRALPDFRGFLAFPELASLLLSFFPKSLAGVVFISDASPNPFPVTHDPINILASPFFLCLPRSEDLEVHMPPPFLGTTFVPTSPLHTFFKLSSDMYFPSVDHISADLPFFLVPVFTFAFSSLFIPAIRGSVL